MTHGAGSDSLDAVSTKVIVCLWARSERFQDPQFVGAVSEGLMDLCREETGHLRGLAQQWFAEFGDDDGPWEFWTTFEHIECNPLAVLAEAHENGLNDRWLA